MIFFNKKIAKIFHLLFYICTHKNVKKKKGHNNTTALLCKGHITSNIVVLTLLRKEHLHDIRKLLSCLLHSFPSTCVAYQPGPTCKKRKPLATFALTHFFDRLSRREATPSLSPASTYETTVVPRLQSRCEPHESSERSQTDTVMDRARRGERQRNEERKMGGKKTTK